MQVVWAVGLPAMYAAGLTPGLQKVHLLIAETDMHLQHGAGLRRFSTALPGSQALPSSTPLEQQVPGSAALAHLPCLCSRSMQGVACRKRGKTAWMGRILMRYHRSASYELERPERSNRVLATLTAEASKAGSVLWTLVVAPQH